MSGVLAIYGFRVPSSPAACRLPRASFYRGDDDDDDGGSEGRREGEGGECLLYETSVLGKPLT